MTSTLFAILFAFGSPVVSVMTGNIQSFMFIIFLITFIIPILSLSVLRLTKTISDITLVDRRERIIPFVFISIFYLTITWLFVARIGMTPMVNLIFIAISVIISSLTVITLFWKISAHGAGVGGLLGFLVAFYVLSPEGDLIWAIIGVILLGGVVMSSRLYLNVHRPKEVHIGGLLGFLISFIVIVVFS